MILLAPGEHSPELLARHDELGLLLSVAATTLTARQLRLIQLHYFEGRTLTQIAGEFGVGVPAISNMHRRALARLRGACAVLHIHAPHEVI